MFGRLKALPGRWSTPLPVFAGLWGCSLTSRCGAVTEALLIGQHPWAAAVTMESSPRVIPNTLVINHPEIEFVPLFIVSVKVVVPKLRFLSKIVTNSTLWVYSFRQLCAHFIFVLCKARVRRPCGIGLPHVYTLTKWTENEDRLWTEMDRL